MLLSLSLGNLYISHVGLMVHDALFSEDQRYHDTFPVISCVCSALASLYIKSGRFLTRNEIALDFAARVIGSETLPSPFTQPDLRQLATAEGL